MRGSGGFHSNIREMIVGSDPGLAFPRHAASPSGPTGASQAASRSVMASLCDPPHHGLGGALQWPAMRTIWLARMRTRAYVAASSLLVVLVLGCTPTSSGSLVISSPTNGSTVTTSTVTVYGTAPANAEVVHDITFAPDTRTTASSDGSWSLAVDLSEGANTLTFRIGDNASTATSITLNYLGTAGGAATPVPADESGATAAPAATFKPITLKGKGKKVAKFSIPVDSAAIAQLTHTGTSNFAVTSVASDGSQNDLLVNTIGKYKGTVLFDSGDNEHSVAFKVDADGSWTIVVKPVTNARAWDGTSVVKGTGDDVLKVSPPPSGLVTLDLRYRGSDNFAVQAFSDSGVDLLANEIGNFSGQVLLPAGTVLIAVTADGGTWSMTPG